MNFFEKAIKGLKLPKTEHIVPDTALTSAETATVEQVQPNVKKTCIGKPEMCIYKL